MISQNSLPGHLTTTQIPSTSDVASSSTIDNKNNHLRNPAWWNFFRNKLELLLDNACDAIPSDDIDAMPKHIRYLIGLLFYCSLICIFSILFLTFTLISSIFKSFYIYS